MKGQGRQVMRGERGWRDISDETGSVGMERVEGQRGWRDLGVEMTGWGGGQKGWRGIGDEGTEGCRKEGVEVQRGWWEDVVEG